MNEHYYLVCVPDHVSATRLFRIDRMKDIQITEEPRSESVARQEAQNAVYAYVGAPEHIVMHCDRQILDDVIDRFGTDIQIRERDAVTFTASFTTPPRGVKFWAWYMLQYMRLSKYQKLDRNAYYNVIRREKLAFSITERTL